MTTPPASTWTLASLIFLSPSLPPSSAHVIYISHAFNSHPTQASHNSLTLHLHSSSPCQQTCIRQTPGPPQLPLCRSRQEWCCRQRCCHARLGQPEIPRAVEARQFCLCLGCRRPRKELQNGAHLGTPSQQSWRKGRPPRCPRRKAYRDMETGRIVPRPVRCDPCLQLERQHPSIHTDRRLTASRILACCPRRHSQPATGYFDAVCATKLPRRGQRSFQCTRRSEGSAQASWHELSNSSRWSCPLHEYEQADVHLESSGKDGDASGPEPR